MKVEYGVLGKVLDLRPLHRRAGLAHKLVKEAPRGQGGEGSDEGEGSEEAPEALHLILHGGPLVGGQGEEELLHLLPHGLPGPPWVPARLELRDGLLVVEDLAAWSHEDIPAPPAHHVAEHVDPGVDPVEAVHPPAGRGEPAAEGAPVDYGGTPEYHYHCTTIPRSLASRDLLNP